MPLPGCARSLEHDVRRLRRRLRRPACLPPGLERGGRALVNGGGVMSADAPRASCAPAAIALDRARPVGDHDTPPAVRILEHRRASVRNSTDRDRSNPANSHLHAEARPRRCCGRGAGADRGPSALRNGVGRAPIASPRAVRVRGALRGKKAPRRSFVGDDVQPPVSPAGDGDVGRLRTLLLRLSSARSVGGMRPRRARRGTTTNGHSMPSRGCTVDRRERPFATARGSFRGP